MHNQNISSSPIPKVSVIVPVYNAELYVERAIVSLMEQTLDDIQVIIIDDGSKDNSRHVIEKVISRYPERYSQVILISRENRGVAATRAQGMELATGDYIIHLDSDDWVELNWLEDLYSKAISCDADVAVCDYFVESYNKTHVVCEKVASEGPVCVKNLLLGHVSNSCWNKLVKANLFHENGIRFYDEYDMGEDFLVTFLVFNNARNVIHINTPLYHYNKINENALTKSYSKKALEDLIGIVMLTEHYLVDNGRLSLYSNELEVFKLGVKLQFALHYHNEIDRIKLAFDLYPDINGKIFKSSFKILKIAYFLKRCNLLFIYKYSYDLWKWLRINFLRD